MNLFQKSKSQFTVKSVKSWQVAGGIILAVLLSSGMGLVAQAETVATESTPMSSSTALNQENASSILSTDSSGVPSDEISSPGLIPTDPGLTPAPSSQDVGGISAPELPSPEVLVQTSPASASSPTLILTGSWGTAPISLDSNGVLTVGGGTLDRPLNDVLESLGAPIVGSPGALAQIVFTAPVIFPVDSMALFAPLALHPDYLTSLTTIEGLSYADTSQVTSMQGMFWGAENLTALDLSSFDTSQVTDMKYMFVHMYGLISLNLSSFTVTSRTDTYGMFGGKGGFPVQTLTLGSAISLKSNMELPDITTMTGYDSTRYTGKWILSDGSGQALTSAELLASYNPATMAGTWVWEEIAPVVVPPVDPEIPQTVTPVLPVAPETVTPTPSPEVGSSPVQGSTMASPSPTVVLSQAGSSTPLLSIPVTYADPSSSSRPSLPNTGEGASYTVSMYGLSLFAAAGLAIVRKRKIRVQGLKINKLSR